MSEIKRLTDIAQRLDELSDEGPSELSALAEEMGGLLDALDKRIANLNDAVTAARREDNMPRYLREIHNIVEREVRSTRGYRVPGNEREMQRMYEDYLRYSSAQMPFKPVGFADVGTV